VGILVVGLWSAGGVGGVVGVFLVVWAGGVLGGLGMRCSWWVRPFGVVWMAWVFLAGGVSLQYL
jgi:hypothetical protein